MESVRARKKLASVENPGAMAATASPWSSASTERELAQHFREIIRLTGEDHRRQALAKTPDRADRAISFLAKGYKQDAAIILSSAVFEEEYSEMIVVKAIEMYSLCEHHLLPFFGQAHIAYIPDGKIVGLSKNAQAVDVFARRLQVQERLSVQIRDAIHDALRPRGFAVVIEAQHLCIIQRCEPSFCG